MLSGDSDISCYCFERPVVANFDEAEIGEPILEVVLEAGDLLYFPRGFIHQGECLPDAHSLHITISSFQKNSWGDLLQRVTRRLCLTSSLKARVSLCPYYNAALIGLKVVEQLWTHFVQILSFYHGRQALTSLL